MDYVPDYTPDYVPDSVSDYIPDYTADYVVDYYGQVKYGCKIIHLYSTWDSIPDNALAVGLWYLEAMVEIM